MEAVIRYRAWIVMGLVLVVAVLAGVLGAGTRGGAGGGDAGADRPQVSFGARVQKLGVTSRLVYTNGWVATDGRQTIGVYAGAETSNRDNGLFVIVRQARGAHPQREASVVVRGAGAVTLLRPASPANESAAMQETLHFVSANGGTGTLDLSNDRVTLSR